MVSLWKQSAWLAATLCACIGIAQAAPRAAAPGTLNYLEGHVTLNDQPAASDGSMALAVGDTLKTEQGMAEVLLTPGVYLRLAEKSTLKWDESSPQRIKVELLRGEALMEVDELDGGRELEVVDQGTNTRVESGGLFDFKASQPAIAVYAGRARVEDDRRSFRLRRGEEMLLNANAAVKPRKFDSSQSDPLYVWSLNRADFAAQVSEWTGYNLLGMTDADSYTAGWYWNPWYGSWAFVPGRGYHVSPFGYGLYAPLTPHYMAPVFGDFQ